jgi:hypothetical protein
VIAPAAAPAKPLVVDPVISRCAEEGNVVSPGSTERANIKFVNQTDQALKIYWLDFAGGRKFYADLAAGASYTQATMTGHVWLVADGADKCVRVATADAETTTVTVTA